MITPACAVAACPCWNGADPAKAGSGIAAKAVKEVTYHAERSAELVIALGDGTEESHARMQAALDRLWPFVGELFESDAVDDALSAAGIVPDPATLEPEVMASMERMLESGTLTRPKVGRCQTGGRSGRRHSEHLGHMLTQMQWLARAYPDARW